MMQFDGEPLSLPTLMDASVPLSLAGDRLRQTLCLFSDHGGNEMALRPDMTLPLAMAIICGDLSASGDYAYDDVAFRLPKAQATNRPIEERQAGFEWMGRASNIETDLAALTDTLNLAEELSLKSAHLRLGDLRVFPELIEKMGLPKGQSASIINAYRCDSALAPVLTPPTERKLALVEAIATQADEKAMGTLAELIQLGGKRVQGARALEDVLTGLRYLNTQAKIPPLTSIQKQAIQQISAFTAPVNVAIERLSDVLKQYSVNGCDDILDRLNTYLSAPSIKDQASAIFTMNFPRRFTYYDGFCFEIFDPNTQLVFGAGGRYDSLVSRLSKGTKNTTAIGAALYPGRIGEALKYA